MDEQSKSNKIITHKQSNVCLMHIKLSHKVNNVKRDLLTITYFVWNIGLCQFFIAVYIVVRNSRRVRLTLRTILRM